MVNLFMNKFLIILFIFFISKAAFAENLQKAFSVECDPATKQTKHKLKFHIYKNLDTGMYEHVTMYNGSKKYLIYQDQRGTDDTYQSLIWYTLWGDKKNLKGWVDQFQFIENAKGETYTLQTMGKTNWELFLETFNKAKDLSQQEQDDVKKALLKKVIDAKQEFSLLHKTCRYLDGEKSKLIG